MGEKGKSQAYIYMCKEKFGRKQIFLKVLSEVNVLFVVGFYLRTGLTLTFQPIAAWLSPAYSSVAQWGCP